MRSRARRGAMAAAAFVVALAIAGGVTVFAGDKASDEVALQPVARDDDGGIEHRVDALLSQMTLAGEARADPAASRLPRDR